MNEKVNELGAMNATSPYPQGRWIPRLTNGATANSRLRPTPIPLNLTEVSLKTLFWNISESDMVQEAAQRLDVLLEMAAVTPPFLTGMDCPMPEVA